MFKRSDGEYQPRKRKGGGIVGVIRLLLSLIIMAILGLGLFMAYQNFTGMNPLKLDPKSIAKIVLSSDSAYGIINKVLTFAPGKPAEGDKNSPLDNLLGQKSLKPTAALDFKFAVIGDPHIDTGTLIKALAQAKSSDAQFVIGIGDLSDVGTIEQLSNSKQQFDTVGLPYYVVPGDHDLWDSRNRHKAAEANFIQVFGRSYQAFTYSNTRFVLVNNSDDEIGLDSPQLAWLEDEISRDSPQNFKPFFVFLSTPLYHPSSDHFMGRKTPKLKEQANHLVSIFKKGGVSEVFAADTHFFSRYVEPTNSLNMTTIGAVTSDRNPQSSRFVMVDVYKDGSYNVEETEVR